MGQRKIQGRRFFGEPARRNLKSLRKRQNYPGALSDPLAGWAAIYYAKGYKKKPFAFHP